MTHLLYESPLIKPSGSKGQPSERYCRLTATDMLVFASKTSSQLNFKKPLSRIPLDSIVSVEFAATEKLQVRHYLQTGSMLNSLSALKKKKESILQSGNNPRKEVSPRLSLPAKTLPKAARGANIEDLNQGQQFYFKVTMIEQKKETKRKAKESKRDGRMN